MTRSTESAEVCQAPGCKNVPTAGRTGEPRRFVVRTSKKTGRERVLHVCRGCYDAWRARKSFKRLRPAWVGTEIEETALKMRRRGKTIREIREALPQVPTRTIYGFFARAGLRSSSA